MSAVDTSATASQAKCASARGRLGREVRRLRGDRWPKEAAAARRDVFRSVRWLTGLKALGLSTDQVPFEVRSRRGHGVWVMARGLGNPIAHGKDLGEATAALVRLLVPDIEIAR